MAKAIQIVKVDKDYRALLKSFSKMDDGAKNEMKKVASDLAERGARYAEGSASLAPFNNRQAMAVAKSIKISKSDKAPSFSIGGRQKVGSSAFSAGYVIMGNEFGSKQYKQFPKRSAQGGKQGWWLFKAMARFQPVIAREWLQGYEKITSSWKSRAI